MQTSVLLFCVLSWMMGPDMKPQTPEVAAIRAYRQGQLTRAAKLLSLMKNRPRRKRERWSRWNAERMRVSYLAARIALKQNQPEKAVKWLQPLVKKPSQIRDYIAFTLAGAMHRSGHPKQAIKLYHYILKEFGRHWRRPIRRRLTVALKAAKQWQDLGNHLKKLLWHPRPYGGRKKVLWQMVKAYLKAGKTKKMRKWLRHFPLRYPMSHEAKQAKTHLRNIQKSQKTYRIKAWSSSEKQWVFHNLAWSHPKQAISRITTKLSAIKGNSKRDRIAKGQLQLVIARAHARMREFQKIIPLAKPLTAKEYPDWMRRRATYLLGRVYTERGFYKKGWKFLHKYAEREPEQKLARWASHWSARLAMMAQNYKRARRFYWEYLKIYPDMSYKKRLQVRWFRAWCLFRMGQYKRTLYAFRALNRRTRSNWLKRRLRYWTGRTYERMGKWKKAQREYSNLIRNTALSYYGILSKQRLYLLEVQIRRDSQDQTCQRRKVLSTLVLPAEIKIKSKRRRKRRRRKRRRRRKKSTKRPKPTYMRVSIKNPMWNQKFTAPWKNAWSMMMDLDTRAPSIRAQLDETMRENVISTIKHSSKPIPFPDLPKYCYRKNTRYCKRARRAQILAKQGFKKEAVDELFRGRWVMKRPQKRLIATIRWFRSVSAHHEAIRMTYWLGNWPSAFKEKEYMSLRYPPAHAPLLFKFTKTYKVSLAFAWGIMREESLFFLNTYSSAAARGLMQLIPKTAYRIAKILHFKRFTLRELYQPKRNIQMGCWYLGQLLHKFESNVPLAAAAYNAGPHRVVTWLKHRHHLAADEFTEEIPFDETREYVRRVLRSYTVYNYLYKRSLPLATTTVAVRIKDNINF